MRKNLFIIYFAIAVTLVFYSIGFSLNADITIDSPHFQSDPYTKKFHRNFCPKLMSHAHPISFRKAIQKGLKPCKSCITPRLLEHLNSEYVKAVQVAKSEAIRVRRAQDEHRRRELALRKNRAAELAQRRVERQQQLQINNARLARLKAERQQRDDIENARLARLRAKRQQQIDSENSRLAAIRINHEINLKCVEDYLGKMFINIKVENTSGFNLPKNPFFAKAIIESDLKFPVNKDDVMYGYKIICNDPSLVYDVFDDGSDFSYGSGDLVVTPKVVVTGKLFNRTVEPVAFDGSGFEIIIHHIIYDNVLAIETTLKNGTGDFKKIKEMFFSIDGIGCEAILPISLSIPPHSAVENKILHLTIPSSSTTLRKTFRNLMQPLNLAMLENSDNEVKLAVSIKFERHDQDENIEAFYVSETVKLHDFFLKKKSFW